MARPRPGSDRSPESLREAVGVCQLDWRGGPCWGSGIIPTVKTRGGETVLYNSAPERESMKPPPFKYLAPDSLEQALELMAQYGQEAKLLAGGQSIIPAMNFRGAQPAVLVV